MGFDGQSARWLTMLRCAHDREGGARTADAADRRHGSARTAPAPLSRS
jgi:hypothetical protein